MDLGGDSHAPAGGQTSGKSWGKVTTNPSDSCSAGRSERSFTSQVSLVTEKKTYLGTLKEGQGSHISNRK